MDPEDGQQETGTSGLDTHFDNAEVKSKTAAMRLKIDTLDLLQEYKDIRHLFRLHSTSA